MGKAESVVRVVYDTLADLSQELSEEHADELFKRISEKKIVEYRDFDLKFVRDFTMNAVRTAKTPGKWYGLDIFWQILQVCLLSLFLPNQLSFCLRLCFCSSPSLPLPVLSSLCNIFSYALHSDR